MIKYDLILLDLDGTIADTDEMIVQTLYEMYDLYAGGKRAPREKIVYFSGPPIRVNLAKEFPDQDLEFMFNEFVRISWDYYQKVVKPFPHAVEVFTNLRNKGVKIGIVTGKARRQTLHCLDVIGFSSITDFVVACDDIATTKPDPEGINKGVEHFGIKDKKKVLYIGDNLADYQAARNAGVDIAMVKWVPRVIKEPIEPDYWLNDFNELEGMISE